MRKLILLAIAFGFTITLKSQVLTQTIIGQVLDQQSKSPLIGATVLVKNSDPLLGSTTDLSGYFRIVNVPLGKPAIQVSSIGYESKTIPNINLTSGKQLVLNVELVESLTEMNEVVVVADRETKGTPSNEMATVSAISLNVEETSRYAATFGDPARAALSQPGIATGGDDLLNEIVIRGNSPKGILWRLEGVEIPNPNHFASVGSSAGGISMLSASVLSNSDFFTAAFPAQYGNATSGIFDLTMRNGNFDKREYSFQAGLLGIQGSAEGPFGDHSNACYLINYRYSTLALFDNIGISILGEQEGIVFQDLAFKFHIPTKKMGTFSIWGLGGKNTYTFRPDLSLDETLYEDDNQKMGAAGITHIAYLNKDTYLESVISLTGASANYIEDSLRLQIYGDEQIIQNQLRISSFINHKFNAKNTLRIGLIGTQMNFELFNQYWVSGENRYLTNLDQEGATEFYQGFTQWRTRINEHLTLNLGFHISHLALNSQTYVEPRAGLRLKTSDKSTFTAGVGLHSRMESLSLYMAQQTQAAGNTEQLNRDLGFTQSWHNVLGYEHNLNNGMRIKTEVYYQYLYNVPVWPLDTGNSFDVLTYSTLNTYDGYVDFNLLNEGTGENYGLELTLEKFFTSDYFFMINGSLYNSKYKGIDGVNRNTQFNGNYIFNLLGGKEFKLGPGGKNLLNINARFILAGGKREAPIDLIQSRADQDTRRDFSRNFESKLSAYKRLDFGVSYKLNKAQSASVISVNAQNVLAIENALTQYYDTNTDNIMTATQLGFFPNLSYRIEF